MGLFSSKKFLAAIFLILPLVLWIPFLLSLQYSDIILFPSAKLNFPYSDSSSVTTIHTLERKEDVIHFSYSLGGPSSTHYAGFHTQFLEDGELIDLSQYDFLDLTISSGNVNGVNLILQSYVDGLTHSDMPTSYRYSSFDLPLVAQKKEYQVPLSEFRTPLWWYELNGSSEIKIGKELFEKMFAINIENSSYAPINISQTVEIEQLIFRKDRRKLLLYTLMIQSGSTLILLLIMLLLRYQKEPLIIPYEKIELASYDDEELEKLVKLLFTEYKKRSLTIQDVALKSGLTTARIATLLKNHFDFTFKQYLNNIRMTEATRLIRETDRQISEIALTVGYSNPTHFNRIFKQIYQIPPKEYRKEETH